MGRIVVITGADRTFFLMACALMQSLKRWAPNLPFYILDFGLDDGQRSFLKSRGVLLDRPANLGAGLHPFLYKSAIGEFLAEIDWSAILWLDSDMIAVGPVEEKLGAVLAEMERTGSEVAACLDMASSIAEFVAIGFEVNPFVEALRIEGVDPAGPYYNVGTVVHRSRDFLAAWRRRTEQIPFHSCFEQNTFNLLVRQRAAPMLLSARQWNLHGALLAEARALPGADGWALIAAGDETALILHATSTFPGQHYAPALLRFDVGSYEVSGIMKLCNNPALRALQISAVTHFAAEHIEGLREAGLVAPASAAAASKPS